MKVVIELLGNESKQDLLATSNYLRELAGETAPATVEKKTDLDKLADAVVDATKVKGEEACLPLLMEAGRAKARAKCTAKPAPVEEAKEAEEAEAPAAPAAPAPKAPAAPVEKPETQHTVEECKRWAMKALNAKKRPLVQEAFEQVGATSFPTLKESMFAEFIEYISTRL